MKVNSVLARGFIVIVLLLGSSCPLASDNPEDERRNKIPVPAAEPCVTPFPPSCITAPVNYYVDASHPAANDKNPGTPVLPWKTIQHAADSLAGNACINVKAGTYKERVVISHSGRNDGFLIFKADGDVVMQGFRLNGNSIAIIGFLISGTPEDHGWLNGGIWINGHNQFLNGNHIFNYINTAGIVPSWSDGGSWENIQIVGNYIKGCNAGIDVSGKNWLVMGNEIESLFRGEQGRDADYMRFFGENLVIKNNYFHGTQSADIGASHVDVFQTFYQSGGCAYNVLIEHNLARDFYHQGIMAEGTGRSHINIVARYNVFAHATAWGICAEGIKQFIIEHNVFYSLGTHGIGFRNSKNTGPNAEGTTGCINYNIFMNVKANTVYWKEAGCNYFSCFNLIYPFSAGTHTSTDYAVTDIVGKDPRFTNPEDLIGPDGIPFSGDDGLRLQADSPCRGASMDGRNIGAY